MKREFKTLDVVNMLVAVAALALSISDKVATRELSESAVRKNMYNAYHLGQAMSVVYAYSHANQAGPNQNGQSQQQIAADEENRWTQFSGQIYANALGISASAFNTFVNEIKTTVPEKVANTFPDFNPSVRQSGGDQGVAAYELGWQLTILAIGFAEKPSTMTPEDYAKARDTLNADLKVVGAKSRFPDSITSTADFLNSAKAALKELESMKS